MRISEEQFREIVEEAIDSLPEKFQKKLNNLAIFVEDFPSQDQLKGLGLTSRYSLFGLYEGYVQSRRRNIGPVLPDRITIFMKPIIKSCFDKNECRKRIIGTVKHEIAHHFGSDEDGARKAGRT